MATIIPTTQNRLLLGLIRQSLAQQVAQSRGPAVSSGDLQSPQGIPSSSAGGQALRNLFGLVRSAGLKGLAGLTGVGSTLLPGTGVTTGLIGAEEAFTGASVAGLPTVGNLATSAGLALAPLALYQLFAQNRNGPLGFLSGAPPTSWQLFPGRVMETQRAIAGATQIFTSEVQGARTQGDLQQAVLNFRARVSDAGVGGYGNQEPGSANMDPYGFAPVPEIGPEGAHGVNLPITSFNPQLNQIREFLAQNASRYPGGPTSVARYQPHQERQAWERAHPDEFQKRQVLAGVPEGWTTRTGSNGEIIGRPPGANWEQVLWQPPAPQTEERLPDWGGG